MRISVVAILVIMLAHDTLAAECDLAGHWEGTLEHQGRQYPIKLDMSCETDRYRVTLDLPEYLIYGSGADAARVEGHLEIKPYVFDNTRITLRYEGGELRGRCEGFREVTADVTMRRVREKPVVYIEESVEFKNGDGQLKGTLLKPAGEGPFPTIVWTHGSGSDTRQTFYYAGRAHLMAQHGVASLIYDKRGAGESKGTRSWDLSVLIDDALAAVAAIKSRADVDPSAIGIAGFSQGGWIAPAVAARDDDVDFVIAGATPGVTGGEQNIYSMVSRMRRDGEPAGDVDAAERFVKRLYEFYQTGRNRDDMVAALEAAKSAPWFENKWVQNVVFIPEDGLPNRPNLDWSPYSPDPMESWRGVHVPVLSMWGGNDIDVPVETSRTRIEQALADIGNTDVRLQVFPGASHGMWLRKDPDIDWDWPRQAIGAHQLMVDWVLERVRE